MRSHKLSSVGEVLAQVILGVLYELSDPFYQYFSVKSEFTDHLLQIFFIHFNNETV